MFKAVAMVDENRTFKMFAKVHVFINSCYKECYETLASIKLTDNLLKGCRPVVCVPRKLMWTNPAKRLPLKVMTINWPVSGRSTSHLSATDLQTQ